MDCDRKKQIRKYIKDIPEMLERKRRVEMSRKNQLNSDIRSYLIGMHNLNDRKELMSRSDYDNLLKELYSVRINLKNRISAKETG